MRQAIPFLISCFMEEHPGRKLDSTQTLRTRSPPQWWPLLQPLMEAAWMVRLTSGRAQVHLPPETSRSWDLPGL